VDDIHPSLHDGGVTLVPDPKYPTVSVKGCCWEYWAEER
jgi:hypothetical protein